MLHRRLVLSLVFVVASSALFASGATEQKAISDELIDDIVSCKPLLSVVLDSNHGEFVDTKSEDKDEILKKGWDSEEIYVHLTKLIHKGKVLPPSLESIRRIAKYHTCFLLSGEKYSRQILFGGDDFDVLGRLRLIIALPPPPGYAFVKDDSIMVLPNKMELSPAETSLKGGTERPGATLLIRYIQLRGDVYDKIDKDDRAYAILSHELTHAYVNALMGWDNIQKLPEWFHEGFATYMGGNKPYESKHVFYKGDIWIETNSLPLRYRDYLRAFTYLRNLKGQQAFSRFVTDSISTGSVKEPLFALCGSRTYEEVLRKAKKR